MLSNELIQFAIYLVPMVLFMAIYLYRHRKHEAVSHESLQEAVKSGLTQPASLHPVIDPSRCLGSGGCIAACPEGTILGLIGHKAHLVNPTHCIGHGACQKACPHDAITLVFGTAERGVDIPEVKPNFETNVPGIFIAGELGGMGLIRNAIEQGRQAMEAIKKRKGDKNQLDVVIIGAGPAGYSASLNALNHKLRFTTIEQESLGGTVAHFPRGKIVMTQPAVLPLVGKVRFRETTKETLLGFWKEVEKKTGIKINYNERMEEIKTSANGFTVTTTKNVYTTRNILLAIGRRGTPRKLGVPGEELPKVVYRLIDPEQYRGQHVLVVGGGDAALEAAISMAEQPDTTITLSYRSESFSRAKEKNRRKITDMSSAGQLTLLMKSNVTRIADNVVTLEQQGNPIDLANDAVIISAGGVLPTAFLKKIGINVDTKYGTV